MNNLALVTFLFFAFFLFFSNKSIIFVFIFNSPSVQHSKNRSTIMKKYFFFYILLLLPIIGIAQTYKYIGVEDGLSNRRVYAIQKGPKGYMWFLTHDGIDRYNGKDFKPYKLMDGDEEVNSMMNLNWLYVDPKGTIWEIGKKGRVFRYDTKHDRFVLVYKLPESEVKGRPTPISYGFVDANSVIWLCNEDALYLYDSNTQKVTFIQNEIGERITDIAQIDSTHFFIGTDIGIHYAELANNILTLSPCNQLDTLKIQINELYYHKPSHKVFIGTFQRGIFSYDLNKHKVMHIPSGLMDISINCIRAFNDNEILIATDGAGVYKMNTDTYASEPYIVADYNRYNSMNGNTINDIYIDSEQRIWMANYPIGITVRNNRYTDYQWIKHSIGNKQSLINDQVNAIIEDHDGDLWFATNNGISLYYSKTKQWHSFLSTFDSESHSKNHTFISLCEVEPGIIWAGGYCSGIYQINNKQLSIDFFTPSLFSNLNIRPDKYIRSIMKDSSGNIWSGGYYNLKEIDYSRKNIRHFPGLNGITAIIEKDSTHMWIGTATGLYLLEKVTGKYSYIQMPVESYYIYSLYQASDGMLYIGTNNAGLLVYDTTKNTFRHYHRDNCALISNNIYTLLSDGKGNIFLSTEHGLSTFYPAEETFHNWTKEQGLKSDHFNAASGTLRKNGNFIFGSTDGAIEFDKDMVLPRDYKFKMVFNDLRVFYQTVYPKDEGSPLILDIDETKTLRLKYNQNIFSLQVSDINYDYPSLILYSWKLEGFYEGWSRPGEENVIRFTNLSPGNYTLRVRAISNEDRRIVLEERSMDIIIEQPLWLSFWALILYAVIIISIASITLRIIVLRKQRKESDEKIRFFVNTAHDIRTPLTLIKAPLEEITEREQLTSSGQSNINTALRNVNALLRLTTNLINFERADTYSGSLYVSEYELSTYMEETIDAFRSYANIKHINLTYESSFRYLNVWLDKDKMDSILKNIISNALKYTPDGGNVHVFTSETEDTWSIEVKDTGIGIPASEQKKLFKMHFRGSNAINSKVTGSGIGLHLVKGYMDLHKGEITVESTPGKGTRFTLLLPAQPPQTSSSDSQAAIKSKLPDTEKASESPVPEGNKVTVLVAEDNEQFRTFMKDLLRQEFTVLTAADGQEGLAMAREYGPDLIISDAMMPHMDGYAFCRAVKDDVQCCHIPLILLTAKNSSESRSGAYEAGADSFIAKPFDIDVLHSRIRQLLEQRERRLASFRKGTHINPKEITITNLDEKLIQKALECIEKNMDNTGYNVEALSADMGIERSSLYRKMQAIVGQTPTDFMRSIRLKRAAQLLESGQYSVQEISWMVGFNTPRYFSSYFKEMFGMTPSAYAVRHRKQPSSKA